MSKSKYDMIVTDGRESGMRDARAKEDDTALISPSLLHEYAKAISDSGITEWVYQNLPATRSKPEPKAMPLDDPRWANQPLKTADKATTSPTLVTADNLHTDLITDVDTAKCCVSVKVGVWLTWEDHRLRDFAQTDTLPTNLWSPRLTLSEAKAGMSVRTCELHHSGGGKMYSLTWYEGVVHNNMDVEDFPADLDDIELTFYASEMHSKGGDGNVNFKSDYRLIFKNLWNFGALNDKTSVRLHGMQALSTHSYCAYAISYALFCKFEAFNSSTTQCLHPSMVTL